MKSFCGSGKESEGRKQVGWPYGGRNGKGVLVFGGSTVGDIHVLDKKCGKKRRYEGMLG